MKFHLALGFVAFVLSPVAVKAGEVPRVDGRLALDTVKRFVQISPRDSGTGNAARAAAWIAGKCREQVADVRIDSWREETAHGPVEFRNVVAVVPGARDQRIIIGSHYDTKKLPGVPDFQGANDSGSSTGLLIEMLRVVVRSGARPPATLEFVFFDGEECVENYTANDGLHGSKRHAKRIKDADRAGDYLAMVLLDMVGDADLGITLSPDTPAKLGEVVLDAGRRLGHSDLFGFHPYRILDDHQPFSAIGIPAIDIIDFDFGPNNSYWHTQEDTLDKLSPRSLAVVGDIALEAIWRIGSEWGNGARHD